MDRHDVEPHLSHLPPETTEALAAARPYSWEAVILDQQHATLARFIATPAGL